MPTKPVTLIQRQLSELADAAVAEHSQRFFKTGPGEYGEGDTFIGIRVPVLRRVAKEHRAITLDDVEIILHSPIHEARLLALLILVLQYAKGDAARRKEIFDLYCANTTHINNWDLVDTSAPPIVGEYLRPRSRTLLHRWATSRDLWRRRIAIIATFTFIKHGDFDDTLAISETLLRDEHDLIHKAVGWMLREVGNRDRAAEEAFLRQHHQTMPRTMLRYAIEKFPETKRKEYLAGAIKG